MIYLFHNIYGDCDHLLATLPDDVQAIPFGWDATTEQARNELLTDIGQSVPSLPCLLIEHPDRWQTFTFDAANTVGLTADDLLAQAEAVGTDVDVP